MDFSYLLLTNVPDEKLLIAYGFTLDQDNLYFKQVNLKNKAFYAKIYISQNSFVIKPFDVATNIEYTLINSPRATGTFVGDLRHNIEEIYTDIINKCTHSNNIKDKLVNYLTTSYDVIKESPWAEYSSFITFKNKTNKKWFGLIMTVKASVFNIKADSNLDIINLKLDPAHILKLIDNKHYFKAYHMNKKYWISIVLNGYDDFETLKKLVRESY